MPPTVSRQDVDSTLDLPKRLSAAVTGTGSDQIGPVPQLVAPPLKIDRESCRWMVNRRPMTAAGVYRELGEDAWRWVLGQVRDDDGPWLPEVVGVSGGEPAPADDRDSLYAGIAGLAPVL